MRFASLSSYMLWPYATGGERTILEIMSALRLQGHEVRIRYAIPPGTPAHAMEVLRRIPARFGFPITHMTDDRVEYIVGGVNVETVRVSAPPASWIGSWLDDMMPDVIMVQAKDLMLLPAITAFWKGKGYLFVQEVEALEALTVSLTHAARARIAASLSVIAVSRFLQDRARNAGFDASLLYPAVARLQPGPGPSRDGPITCFGSSRQKGADIVVTLARTMPDARFRIVTGWNETPPPSEPANLEFAPFAIDPRPYYHECSLVLVPSRIHEGFGRIAHEAMAAGRVPIVADRGALSEVVGEAGVVPSEREGDGTIDVTPWAHAIVELMGGSVMPYRAALCERRARVLTAMARAQFESVFGIAYPEEQVDAPHTSK